MNFFIILICFLIFINSSHLTPLTGGQLVDNQQEVVGENQEENEDIGTTQQGPSQNSVFNEQITTTHPTFTVQRLDAPIERIEIRLIDENNTNTEHLTSPTVESETQQQAPPTEQYSYVQSTSEPSNDHHEEQMIHTTNTPDRDENMYKKTEYVVQPTAETTENPQEYSYETTTTSEPVVIGEDASYFQSTMPSQQQSEIQAKAWISVSTPSIPKFEGDIDDDDLPPPPSNEQDEDDQDPEEECLANKEQLTEETITRLKAETAHYYRLVKQRNDQQKEYCTGENASNMQSEMYRRCSDWRAEKLVFYYKLMRKTYCQVDHWPNPSKIKKTYGEYLNLFGTFYAFQK